MAAARQIDREEIVAMLKDAADAAGISLRRFHDLGEADALDNPVLRDLWLIWGDVLDEHDLEPAAAA